LKNRVSYVLIFENVTVEILQKIKGKIPQSDDAKNLVEMLKCFQYIGP